MNGYIGKPHKISDPTATKKYRVTPTTTKYRFVPDIIKNGRIQYPGVYELNIREARRVQAYGYIVEEVDEEKPDIPTPPHITPDPDDEDILQFAKMDSAKIGFAKIL